MMGSKNVWYMSSLGGALALLSACTVEPRAPVYDPADRPLKSDERAKENDDSFRLPRAEQVPTGSARPATPTEAPSDGAHSFTELGHAKISIGARPPWASLEAIQTEAVAPGAAPREWRMHKSIVVGQGYLHHAAFIPGAQSVVTLSNQSGRIYHYDLDGKLLHHVDLQGFREFDDAAFTPLLELEDRPQVFITRPEGTGVLDLESGKVDTLTNTPAGTDIEHTGRPGLYGVTFRTTTPQSGQLVLQWISGEVALRARCEQRPDGFALSPDGRYLALAYYPAEQVEVLDLKEEKVVSTLKLPKWGSAIAISPDGKWLALGGERLQVASFPDGHVVAEDADYENNIDTVRFTPQGDLLLASAYDGKARSYAFPSDLAQVKKLPKPQLLRHSGTANVYALGLTPDGRMLVTSSGDETIKIWKR
jgi:WD40 repeat protein